MSVTIYPAGSLFKVEMEIRIPVDATDEQIEEWAQHCISKMGSLNMANPLAHSEPEEFGRTFSCEPTGFIGREEEYDHKTLPNGGKSYRVRTIREPGFVP